MTEVQNKPESAQSVTPEETLKKIQRLTDLYETTFDWGCNDESTAMYANAIYACMHPELDYWQHSIEDFEQHILDAARDR